MYPLGILPFAPSESKKIAKKTMRAIDRARRKKEENECKITAKNSAMTPGG